MTRKDYVALAEAIRFATERSMKHGLTSVETISAIRTEIGNVLLADNNNFDRERFEEACKL